MSLITIFLQLCTTMHVRASHNERVKCRQCRAKVQYASTTFSDTLESLRGGLIMDATGFIKERVGLFKDFTAERIKQLVDGSLVRSFETNEAIAHQGAEATHFGSRVERDSSGLSGGKRHAATARTV